MCEAALGNAVCSPTPLYSHTHIISFYLFFLWPVCFFVIHVVSSISVSLKTHYIPFLPSHPVSQAIFIVSQQSVFGTYLLFCLSCQFSWFHLSLWVSSKSVSLVKCCLCNPHTCAQSPSGYCESNSKPIYPAELQFLSLTVWTECHHICLQFISWRP